MSCGCNKNKTKQSRSAEIMRSRGTSEAIVRDSVTDSDDFIEAIYNGPKYPHNMRSATGIITEYGITHYGVGKRGDKIRVHRIDLENGNGLYLVNEDEMNKGIRGPEFTDKNRFSAEADTNKRINDAAQKAEKEIKKDALTASKVEEIPVQSEPETPVIVENEGVKEEETKTDETKSDEKERKVEENTSVEEVKTPARTKTRK